MADSGCKRSADAVGMTEIALDEGWDAIGQMGMDWFGNRYAGLYHGIPVSWDCG